MLTPFLSTRTARAAVLTAVVLLAGCGSDPAADRAAEPAAGGASERPEGVVELSAGNERACDQAREVTSGYATGLQSATTADQARVVVDDAVAGLRDIDAEPPVDASVDGVADALSALLTAVEEQRRPEELRPVAEQIGQATDTLAADCGIEPEAAPGTTPEPAPPTSPAPG